MKQVEDYLSPAPEEEIRRLEEWLGQALPVGYREFLGTSNGLEKDGVYLYPVQEIPAQNDVYSIREYSQDYLNIGDNGGGRAYVISLREPFPVFAVGHGSMHPDDLRPVSDSFAAWVASGFSLPTKTAQPSWARPIDIWLERQPGGGLKDLHLIRKLLAPELPLSELIKRASEVPIVIARGVPYGRYHDRITEINQKCGDCLQVKEIEK